MSATDSTPPAYTAQKLYLVWHHGKRRYLPAWLKGAISDTRTSHIHTAAGNQYETQRCQLLTLGRLKTSMRRLPHTTTGVSGCVTLSGICSAIGECADSSGGYTQRYDESIDCRYGPYVPLASLLLAELLFRKNPACEVQYSIDCKE